MSLNIISAGSNNKNSSGARSSIASEYPQSNQSNRKDSPDANALNSSERIENESKIRSSFGLSDKNKALASENLKKTLFYYNRKLRVLWSINLTTNESKKFQLEHEIRSFEDSGIGVLKDQSVIVIGGTDSRNQLTKSVFLLNPFTREVKTLKKIPFPAKNGQIFEYNHKFFYIGGAFWPENNSENEQGAPVLKFSPLKNSWKIYCEIRSDSNLDWPISHYGVLKCHSKLFLVGGKIKKNKKFKKNKKIFCFDLKEKPPTLRPENFNFGLRLESPICASFKSNAVILSNSSTQSSSKRIYLVDLKNKQISHIPFEGTVKVKDNYPGTVSSNTVFFFSDEKLVFLSQNGKLSYEDLEENDSIEEFDDQIPPISHLPKFQTNFSHNALSEKNSSKEHTQDLPISENSDLKGTAFGHSLDIDEIPHSSRQVRIASSKVNKRMIEYLDSENFIQHNEAVCVSINLSNAENESPWLSKAALSQDDLKKLYSYSKIDAENDFLRNFPRRWPNGIIPYEIDQLLAFKQNKHDESFVNLIKQAIESIEKTSIIKFTKNTSDIFRLQFKWHRKRSHSNGLGKNIDRENLIFLSKSASLSTVAYEIMHKLGIIDEYETQDHKKFVLIKERIQKAKREDQEFFELQTIAIHGFDLGPSDPYSIMRFASKSIPFQTSIFTHIDSAKINYLYGSNHCATFFEKYFFNSFFSCSSCFGEMSPFLLCLPCAYTHHYAHQKQLLSYQDIINNNYSPLLDFSEIVNSQTFFCASSNSNHDKNCTKAMEKIKNSQVQPIFNCVDCINSAEPKEAKGICFFCIQNCHKGHNIVYFRYSRHLTCQCGSEICKSPCKSAGSLLINFINLGKRLTVVNVDGKTVSSCAIDIRAGIHFADSGYCSLKNGLEFYYGNHWEENESAQSKGHLYSVDTSDLTVKHLGSHAKKSQMGVCEVGSLIYVFGGSIHGKLTSKCESFSLETNEWTVRTQMPIVSFSIKCEVMRKTVFLASLHFLMKYHVKKDLFEDFKRLSEAEHRIVLAVEKHALVVETKKIRKYDTNFLGKCVTYPHEFEFSHFAGVVKRENYAYFVTGYNPQLFQLNLKDYNLKKIELELTK